MFSAPCVRFNAIQALQLMNHKYLGIIWTETGITFQNAEVINFTMHAMLAIYVGSSKNHLLPIRDKTINNAGFFWYLHFLHRYINYHNTST